ncbi:V-type ATP synthase subunit I [Coprothermobacter platensis]|uniref:V-type ATP synthase subunit I n=1 Tax=Coprothermobacter platensis TaxID=108819 RepID=UPI000382B431|nr:V-type ATP synthase subunit I [Coprothermobacter platensis]
MAIAELMKVGFCVPKSNVGALRKYLFEVSDFHPLDLNGSVLGDFASLKERLEHVVNVAVKRKPQIYGTSILSEKEEISSGYIEIGPILSHIEELLDKEQQFLSAIETIKRQLSSFEPFAWVSAPWDKLNDWQWLTAVLLKKNKNVLKLLENSNAAWFEGDNGVIAVVYKGDDELLNMLRDYMLDQALLTDINALLKDLNNQRNTLEEELREVQDQLGSLLEENASQIKRAFDYYTVSLDYARLIKGSVDTNFLGIVVGYVPRKLYNSVLHEVEMLGGTAVELPQEEQETFPTKLVNSSFFKPYESIVLMYGPPLYSTYDPTPLVALWWNFFFAFMLGDAGFGLIITLASLYGLRKLKSMKQLSKLGLNIGIATMAVGTVTWSWFSTQPFLINGKALGLFYPLNSNDVNTMLVISLAIGVGAQFYAMGIKGWWMLKHKDYLGFWSDVFCWWGLLSSLIWLLLGGGTMAEYTAIFFAVNLLLFQGRASKNWIARIGMGLIGLYGIISPYGVASFLGDALSYSRLMALNLTGALMGQVFNTLSFSVMKSGIVGMVAGALMFVLFQVFNFAISALGAFVHSIRLLFLEMYGRFYEGNGESFKPLRRTGRYYEFKEVDYE